MTQINTAAAHIVTGAAQALGDPEIIVMTQADEIGETRLIARRRIPADAVRSWELKDMTTALGWRWVGNGTEVEPGYIVVDLERICSPRQPAPPHS